MRKFFLFLLLLFIPVSSSALEAHFIDVGQADACIIVCDGEAMLIDGGKPSASDKIFSYIKDTLQLAELKYIVASHPHEDHIGGIAAALNAVPAGCIFSPVTEWDTRAFDSMVKYAEAQGTPIVVPYDGDTFNVGSATVTVLLCWPDAWSANDMSIVLRVDYNGHSFLFTGDAEYTAEYMLIDSGADLDADVLKVSHHGSNTSSTQEFIDAVSPSIAVISAGAENQYGHPTQEVLDRLNGVEVLRTDIHGTIILRCCENIERSCEK